MAHGRGGRGVRLGRQDRQGVRHPGRIATATAAARWGGPTGGLPNPGEGEGEG